MKSLEVLVLCAVINILKLRGHSGLEGECDQEDGFWEEKEFKG